MPGTTPPTDRLLCPQPPAWPSADRDRWRAAT
jgi:hypothetical protein